MAAVPHQDMIDAFIVCGFDNNSSTWLVNYGIQDAEELHKFSESELTDLHKMIVRHPPANVTSSIPKIRNVMVFKFWVAECLRTNYTPDPNTFSPLELEKYAKVYQSYTEVSKTMMTATVDTPEPMRKMAGWPKFKERFLTYLTQVLGVSATSLKYVVRDDPDSSNSALDPDDYDTHDDYLYVATELSGPHYEADNKQVYLILKRCILDGDAALYIKRFDKKQDGRGAFVELKSRCEGESAELIRKNKAYNSIRTLRFNGVGRKYSLEEYTRAHTAAHTDLFECNEEPHETKKVNDYLNGISDPSIEVFKGNIWGNPARMNSFELTSKYLLNCVATKTAVDGTDRRSVSAMQSHGDGAAKLPDDFKLEDKFYKPHIFRLLSKEQKEQLTAWAEKKKKNRGSSSTDSRRSDKRKIKALKKKLKKALSRDSESSEDDEDVEEEKDNAGQQFGRDAHTKKTKKRQKR